MPHVGHQHVTTKLCDQCLHAILAAGAGTIGLPDMWWECFSVGQCIQARSVLSSSLSAHLITSSSFSPPWVYFDTMTVLIAWL
jgi:hypothetical protein